MIRLQAPALTWDTHGATPGGFDGSGAITNGGFRLSAGWAGSTTLAGIGLTAAGWMMRRRRNSGERD